MADNKGIAVDAATMATLATGRLQSAIAALLRTYSEQTGLAVERVDIRAATVGLNHPILHEYEVVAIVQSRRGGSQ